MKRFVIVLCTVLLVSGFVFADVSVSAWGRGQFSFAQNTVGVLSGAVDTANNYVSAGPNWGGGARVGVAFHGTSDNIGFDLNIDTTGAAAPAVGDNARINIKFNDMLTVQLGKSQGDELRGKLGNNLLTGGEGEDAIFTRFYPKSGLLAKVTPVTGVFLGAAVDVPGYVAKLNDVYKAIQIGAGYTIENIGLIRAQYIGNAVDTATQIQAAFQLTAVKNLNADVGLTFKNGVTDANTSKISFSAAASYSMDAIGIYARVGSAIGAGTADTTLPVSARVSYKVTDKATVGVEFNSGNLLAKTNPEVDFAPYVNLGLAGGSVTLGFVALANDGNTTNFGWMIPLSVDYGF